MQGSAGALRSGGEAAFGAPAVQPLQPVVAALRGVAGPQAVADQALDAARMVDAPHFARHQHHARGPRDARTFVARERTLERAAFGENGGNSV